MIGFIAPRRNLVADVARRTRGSMVFDSVGISDRFGYSVQAILDQEPANRVQEIDADNRTQKQRSRPDRRRA